MDYNCFLTSLSVFGILFFTGFQKTVAVKVETVQEVDNYTLEDVNSSSLNTYKALQTPAVYSYGSRRKSKKQGRIVGGRPAQIGQFPYQVSLRDARSNQHLCGGSIISSTWILTAAHCVPNTRPADIIIVVGTNYLNAGGTSYAISQIISHPAYNSQTNVNDIAVLKVKGQISAGTGIGGIGLASSTTPPGSSLVLSGWGLTSYPSTNIPNNLQTITLRSISVAQCQQLLPGYPVFATHVCTYAPAGQGACQGDSGGPLVLNGIQHGIVSWGIPCAKGNPDVFTSVSAYRSWIRVTTGL